jgi:hypothetical protein
MCSHSSVQIYRLLAHFSDIPSCTRWLHAVHVSFLVLLYWFASRHARCLYSILLYNLYNFNVRSNLMTGCCRHSFSVFLKFQYLHVCVYYSPCRLPSFVANCSHFGIDMMRCHVCSNAAVDYDFRYRFRFYFQGTLDQLEYNLDVCVCGCSISVPGKHVCVRLRYRGSNRVCASQVLGEPFNCLLIGI